MKANKNKQSRSDELLHRGEKFSMLRVCSVKEVCVWRRLGRYKNTELPN